MAEKDTPKALEMSALVKDKFKMKKGFPVGEYRFKGATIDTSNCSLEELAEAVKKGFDVVEEAKASTPSK